MNSTILPLLLGGLFLLVGGAELFVRGASRIAALLGVSPLVIGLTVVALGTSSPEIAVSLQSSLAGSADLALGNVLGSNICNVLLILGTSALITPLVVAQRLVWLDVPLMIAASVAVLLFGLDGRIGRSEGSFFVLGAILYTVFLLRQSRRESQAVRAEYKAEFGVTSSTGGLSSWILSAGFVLGGLATLVLGSRWLVQAAVTIAQGMGVSELVIGLTVVAVGTSLPELATSILAALRKERDIAVGNIVGSNLFNILLVLGLTGAVTPGGVPVPGAALAFDIPVMIAVAVACLPIFFTGHRIVRWEGLLFLGYYAVYTAYLVLASARHEALPLVSLVMGFFVLPLTFITLGTIAVRAWRTLRRNVSGGN